MALHSEPAIGMPPPEELSVTFEPMTLKMLSVSRDNPVITVIKFH